MDEISTKTTIPSPTPTLTLLPSNSAHVFKNAESMVKLHANAIVNSMSQTTIIELAEQYQTYLDAKFEFQRKRDETSRNFVSIIRNFNPYKT